MGLIRRIGRAIGRIGRAIGGAVKGVVGFASKALSAVTGFAGGLMGGCLAGLPFGNMCRGFCNQFMGSPFGMMAASTMGAFGAMLGFASTQRQLCEASHYGCQSQAYQHPYARQNMAYMMSYNQARIMASNGWYA
jgi:hypothetical protein